MVDEGCPAQTADTGQNPEPGITNELRSLSIIEIKQVTCLTPIPKRKKSKAMKLVMMVRLLVSDDHLMYSKLKRPAVGQLKKINILDKTTEQILQE
ncbi:hypothetical protein DPMN_045186 [Dreissena polymorpha]|uniref:Uncharacterized protein n=1 Tax=Dreissena polymorpha TaxID=45954 RepID=A0A9D4HZE9_DREPO|nr:hypothetical protein DPMN_045186 [Dreissena polymorpha]